VAIYLSTAVGNAALDSFEATIGTAALLRILDGAMPTACASADVGVKLAEMTLPSDWMAAASGGTKAKAGTWSDPSANASGTAQYFRIYESTGTTCHMQGTVSATGGGGDLTLDDTSITAAQVVTVTAFTITALGAPVASHRTVTYTATGSEGTDFMVSIGATLSLDTYAVLYAPSDVVNVPVLSLPTATGSDRTTTQFRVTTADSLTAGDVLIFVILE
jgi:mono/diheme cytochrome c family protein